MKKRKSLLLKKLRVCLAFLILLFATLAATAQTTTIKGVIIDDKGQPVAGATIREQGGQQTTVSGEDGSYTLNVKTGATIIISHTGFAEREISTRGNDFNRVELKELNTQLDDVVVVGYGSRRKSEVTGAITSV